MAQLIKIKSIQIAEDQIRKFLNSLHLPVDNIKKAKNCFNIKMTNEVDVLEAAKKIDHQIIHGQLIDVIFPKFQKRQRSRQKVILVQKQSSIQNKKLQQKKLESQQIELIIPKQSNPKLINNSEFHNLSKVLQRALAMATLNQLNLSRKKKIRIENCKKLTQMHLKQVAQKISYMWDKCFSNNDSKQTNIEIIELQNEISKLKKKQLDNHYNGFNISRFYQIQNETKIAKICNLGNNQFMVSAYKQVANQNIYNSNFTSNDVPFFLNHYISGDKKCKRSYKMSAPPSALCLYAEYCLVGLKNGFLNAILLEDNEKSFVECLISQPHFQIKEVINVKENQFISSNRKSFRYFALQQMDEFMQKMQKKYVNFDVNLFWETQIDYKQGWNHSICLLDPNTFAVSIGQQLKVLSLQSQKQLYNKLQYTQAYKIKQLSNNQIICSIGECMAIYDIRKKEGQSIINTSFTQNIHCIELANKNKVIYGSIGGQLGMSDLRMDRKEVWNKPNSHECIKDICLLNQSQMVSCGNNSKIIGWKGRQL